MHIFAECIVIVFTNMYGLKHFLTSPLTLLQLIWMAVCENRVTYPQKHSPLKTRTISVQSCTLANWNNRIRFTYIYVSSSSSSWRLVLHSVMASDWIYIQHKTNPLPTCCRTFYLLHTLFLLIIIIKPSRKKNNEYAPRRSVCCGWVCCSVRSNVYRFPILTETFLGSLWGDVLLTRPVYTLRERHTVRADTCDYTRSWRCGVLNKWLLFTLFLVFGNNNLKNICLL